MGLVWLEVIDGLEAGDHAGLKLCFWKLHLAAVSVDWKRKLGRPAGVQKRRSEHLHPRKRATGTERMHECERHVRDKFSGILETGSMRGGR